MSYITVMRRVYGSGGESWDEYAQRFDSIGEALAFVDMMNDQFIGEFYFIGE